MKTFLCASLLFLYITAIAGSRIELKRNSGTTSIQIANALSPVVLSNGSSYTIQAGDTIVLSGNYGAINIYNITQGTKGNEVVFINQGQVIVNGKVNVAPVNFTCSHVKFLFNLDPLYPYGLKIRGASPDSILLAGIKLVGVPNSDNYEICGVEIYNSNIGMFENPASGNSMYNISIHDCYFHDLYGIRTSEAIYFGYSTTSGYFSVPRFYNLKIEHCRFENLEGDGVQVKGAEATVSYCYFYNTGKALLAAQGDALQFGNFAYGKIQNNLFVDCRQHAILHRGSDTSYIINNRFSRISNTGPTNDVVYINTIADTVNSPKLVMYMHNNVFDSVTIGRALINNAGNVNSQNISYYYQNCDTACTWGASNKFLLNSKDQYTACTVIAPKTINVNVYGGTDPYANAAWNDWSIGTATASNITSGAFKYSDGTLSTVKAILSYNKGINDNGTSYGSPLAPNEVIRYTGNSSSPTRTLTLNGLSVSKTYTIELYASYKLASGADTINHTIFSSGGKADTILTANNTSDKAVLASLTPDATGKIVITSSRWQGTWSYLNGFKITENISGARIINQPAGLSVSAAGRSVTGSKDVEVYPNPANDQFMLQLNNPYKGSLKVSIVDMGGRTQKYFSFIKDQNIFQKYIGLNGIAPGTYLVEIQAGKRKTVKAIVKQ